MDERPEKLTVDFRSTLDEHSQPSVRIEQWQTPGGKWRTKMIVEPPWVVFSRDSFVQRILAVREMLTEVEEPKPERETKEKGPTIAEQVNTILREQPDKWFDGYELVELIGGSRPQVMSALRKLTGTKVLEESKGSGQGQRNKYRLNRNRTQSVPEPQGTVTSGEERQIDFDKI